MSIPESRVEAILSNILGEDYEVKLGKSRVEDLLIGIAGVVANTPQLDNDGLIPISYIPPIAFEQCVTVQDDTARFALTTDDVQNGDCVYVNSSQIMYFVVDDTKLDLVAGYKALAAGMAAQAVADKDGNQIDTTYATKNELSGKQDTIDSNHKLNADLVDDSNSTNKFTSANEKSTWNGKQDALTFDTTPTDSSTNPVTSGGVYSALSGKQSTIDSSHKLDADLVDDSSATHKFATSAQLSQITTNTAEIVGQENATTAATPGRGYALINGIRLYANPSGTPPTGDIPDGSYGLF